MFGFIRDTAAPPRRSGDFVPGPLRLVEAPPSPLPRRVLYWITALIILAGVWLGVGRLDIVAVASGKLAPRTSLKILQPADAGRIAEIAVTEGESVLAGQVLLRLDPDLHDAESRALRSELGKRTLQLRRIDAELADATLLRFDGDTDDVFARADAQYRANRLMYADALSQETSAVARIGLDLRGAEAVLQKLQRTVPIYQTVAERYARLQTEGFVSELFLLEKQRDRIEKEQDLAAQGHAVDGLRASHGQAQQRLAQVTSSYRAQLHAERAQAASQKGRLDEDLAKQIYRATAVELRAPQAGIVKDLASHTVGTVVAPGTILLTLVPAGEELQADVLVRNLDVGFVRSGQRAKVKVATYPFQKYGIVDGTVVHVSPDAADGAQARRELADDETSSSTPNGYRARIALTGQQLAFDGRSLPLASGMQVDAEILLGERTLLEYVLAPIQKAWHEAARER